MTQQRPPVVLFSGTADDVARAQAAASPAHLWPEARNPANQWLADLKGQQRLRREVVLAGMEARSIVRQGFIRAGYPVPPHPNQKDLR